MVNTNDSKLTAIENSPTNFPSESITQRWECGTERKVNVMGVPKLITLLFAVLVILGLSIIRTACLFTDESKYMRKDAVIPYEFDTSGDDQRTKRILNRAYGLQQQSERSLNYDEQQRRILQTNNQQGINSNQTGTDLKIAWLMSFPNSGTSYTGKLIRKITQTLTASNYGDEDKVERRGDSIRVYDDQRSGPFYVEVNPDRHPERKQPQEYVLTKTHCGIRCEICPPQDYIETTFSFRHRCFSGSWSEKRSDGTIQVFEGAYPAIRVAKAVHLIRDPFDNIVSRFHLEQHESKSSRRRKRYSNDRDGFRAFCEALNERYAADEKQYEFLNPALHKLTADIPCRTDFLRYTEWHNLAFSTTRDMELDTYVLHYDDYTTRFTETVSELLEFLHLEAVAKPEPFVAGKEYRDYFTEDERRRLRVAIEWMSSPITWQALKHYFEEKD